METAIEATGFTLWHRASRRHKWRVVGAAPTSAAAYALMPADTRHGDWIVKPAGDDPNPVHRFFRSEKRA